MMLYNTQWFRFRLRDAGGKLTVDRTHQIAKVMTMIHAGEDVYVLECPGHLCEITLLELIDLKEKKIFPISAVGL